MIRINITLEKEDLKLLDALAARENKSRSEFLRSVVKFYSKQLSIKKEREILIAKAIQTQDELRAKKLPWNATGELRRQRKLNK